MVKTNYSGTRGGYWIGLVKRHIPNGHTSMYCLFVCVCMRMNSILNLVVVQ